MIRLALLLSAFVLPLALAACGSASDDPRNPSGPSSAAPASGRVVDVGLVAGYQARLVADSLSSPTSIAFSPTGLLTVADSAAGRVVAIRDGRVEPLVTGFATELAAPAGTRPRPPLAAGRVGPLSVAWVNAATLAVTDAGRPDGEERILLFPAAALPADASAGQPTNPIPPTTDDPADRGEGNLTGLSVAPDMLSLYLAANGSDARNWLLRADLESMQLRTFASADLNGISANAPVATLIWDARSLLALYAGSPTKSDALIVQWDLATARPLGRWSLPALVNPTAFARIGYTDELAIVARGPSSAASPAGQLARVRLPFAPAAPGSADASATSAPPAATAIVTILATRLDAPTAAAFGPDARLYLTQLGPAPGTPTPGSPDRTASAGSVIALTGFALPAAGVTPQR